MASARLRPLRASADEEQPITVGGCVQEACRLGARRGQVHRCHAVVGDLFASGFLYGLVKVLPLEECCKVGACSGGSVTRALGGEVRPENWQWMYKQMHARGLLLPELKN